MTVHSLIPFGLYLETNELVDVGSVPQGKACNCICPSCKTPLVARHGRINEWHFAHQSQNTYNKTSKDCDYSFAVSVRLMILQLSSSNLKFKTPELKVPMSVDSEYSYESADFSMVVATESLFELQNLSIAANFDGVTVDILGYTEDIPFIIFITHRNRTLPPRLKEPTTSKCGVIELNVDNLTPLFKQEKNGQYKEVLRKYIQEETDGKEWAYHPREKYAIAIAEKNRDSWLLKQEKITKSQCSILSQSQHTTVQKTAPVSDKEKYLSQDGGVHNYICIQCNNEWIGSHTLCERCRTHLFSKIIIT